MSRQQLYYGDSIPGSKYYRAFCPRCDAEVRVSSTVIKGNKTIFCQDCNPPHMGVGAFQAGWNDDHDAFKKANDQ